MAFCDFCPCGDCRNGTRHLSHANTADGRWICGTCYLYDECVRAQRKAGDSIGPCDELDCKHRPTIVGPWIRFGEAS